MNEWVNRTALASCKDRAHWLLTYGFKCGCTRGFFLVQLAPEVTASCTVTSGFLHREASTRVCFFVCVLRLVCSCALLRLELRAGREDRMCKIGNGYTTYEDILNVLVLTSVAWRRGCIVTRLAPSERDDSTARLLQLRGVVTGVWCFWPVRDATFEGPLC